MVKLMKYINYRGKLHPQYFFLLLIILDVVVVIDSNAQPFIYTPPTESAKAVEGIPFSKTIPIDENYRAQFERCDRENIFNGKVMGDFRQCTNDKSHVKALLRFPDNTVFFEAKLSLDIDGSWKACNEGGPTDQCPTWYEWANLPEPNRYVDSDKYPFIVIPIAGLKMADKEFRNKTGINKGDLGIVVYKDKVVPVFVADGGPHNKLGEGSSALFKALGEDRCLHWREDSHCAKYRDVSIPDKVLFFIFPKSKLADITPNNALEKIKMEATKRFEKLR